MSNEIRFEVSPTCPFGLACKHEAECMSDYFLKRELTTDLPRQQEAVDALISRAACTDPGFLETLWEALTFLIRNPRK